MDKTQFQPQNPDALFSPDQWTNQFSNYNNRALPWPSAFYTGTPAGSMPPTDAMGRPIQSFLDMQAKHDAWQPPAPASSTVATPMGTDPNFGLENQWLAANNQPVQLAPTRTPGQLGPQTQAALQAMMGGQGQSPSPSGLASGAQGAQNQSPLGPQAVPGTTLNSTPQGSAPMPQGQSQSPSGLSPAAANSAPGSPSNGYGDFSALAPSLFANDPARQAAYANELGLSTHTPGGGLGGGGSPASSAAPAAPTNPFDMHQAYLDALANPGKVTTPGATVPAGPSAQPGPGSLSAFLANWRPAQSGPGSGFQQGFGGALKGMGY